MELDYKSLGLRVGLEIHQQIDTRTKLFCACPTESEEKVHGEIRRYLRPSLSETGEVDIAALTEWRKGKRYVYLLPNNYCMVETDEEPPHPINEDAVKLALAFALAVGAKPVDEVYVMRKIVIDGSNTSGFQRTAIIAMGGQVEDKDGTVRLETITVEEDAARKVEDRDNETVFNLDRLGVPLIEISTAPDIHSPEQAMRVAQTIGQILRMTGKVKRGLGTIRQDLNVSIAGGEKTEIKGVQELELIPKIVAEEARRQYELLRIRDEPKRRGLTPEIVKEGFKATDLTEVFKATGSKLIRKELEKGGKVLGAKVVGFRGIFGWEVMTKRRFGTEVSDYVKVHAGLGGLFHSDELPNYGITAEEVENVKKVLGVGSNDAFVLVVGPEDKARKALDVILERVVQAFQGVPKETRAALEDGTTRYMRPRPGAARMYPETDIPPFRITERVLEEAKKLVPESPEQKLKKYLSWGLSDELAKAMLRNPKFDFFESLVTKYPNVPPSLIANVFENYVKYAKSKGGNVEKLSDADIEEIIRSVSEGKILKDAVQDVILQYTTTNKPLTEVLKSFSTITDDELRQIVKSVIEELGEQAKADKKKAFNAVMGKVMGKVRGRAEGKKVAEIINEELNKVQG
ncbi:MAG: Glu-tRNA(Gln) amidotransferase subunit GatE [Thermoprotei archaeon]